MYEHLEPYDSGFIATSDGNSIYWECCGNPNGNPIVYLHGGPGSGFTSGARRFFDPDAYRIVLFDQRGCGRSRPLPLRPADLSLNTTPHLIDDIELIRTQLHIDRWIVVGASWGRTLALAYAEAHPDVVRSIVLASITTTSRREVDWITRDVGRMFPEQWERFAGHIPHGLRDVLIVDAYATLLFDDDASVCDAAAAAWCAWEDAHVSLMRGHLPNPRFQDADFRLRFARIVTHYWRHAAFIEDGELLKNAPRLSSIPGILLHGRYDVSSPLVTAWNLHNKWAGSELTIVDDGHGGMPMAKSIVAALHRFRTLRA